jgi:hypothetical protein
MRELWEGTTKETKVAKRYGRLKVTGQRYRVFRKSAYRAVRRVRNGKR